MKTPLVLDVDTGIDDSLALLYATASDRADLMAVTTCAGNTDLDSTTRNTLSVLELAGAGQVEVAKGRPEPLVRGLVTAPQAHGPGGLGRAVLPAPAASPSLRSAAELIVESAHGRPGELTLVALGPLTNVAVAVQAEPRLPRLLKRLVIMGGGLQNDWGLEAGGGLRSGDGAGPTADRNTSVDPEAAAIVYREFGRAEAQLPLVIGLDVTRTVKLLPEDLARLRTRAGGVPLTRFVEGTLSFYFDYHEKRYGFRGAFMHDPFVVGAALDPGLLDSRPMPVTVEAEADVAFSGAGDLFIRRLIDRLVALA
ncbi:MAG: nucleoside hydrolase [Thermoleophilia bacterium]|nr:nucleoside hydrolase [Thermoleophilia bacterium]